MNKLKYAIIGCGRRGGVLYTDGALKNRKDAVCVALCDFYEDRLNSLACEMEKEFGEKPALYTDYKKCIVQSGAEAVIISTSWDTHIEIALYAMENGVPAGVEVGGAYSMDSLWRLVRCYERTGTPVMMLENCCYGRLELLALNMKRLGLLGEIVHCEGGYCHDLREQVAHGIENRHYRFMQYKHRNTENYPTHELGPIAKVLDINCGNRFLSLHSVASKSVGMKEYVQENGIESLKDTEFIQGDVISTTIKCVNGEVINLTLDTTLPRYYTRRFFIRGSKGIISEENKSVYLASEHKEEIGDWAPHYNNLDEYYKKYDHAVWKDYDEKGGHGGLDWLVISAFFDAVRNNKPMPLDVYDMAAYMSVSVLAEESLATGNTVYFPDFTEGKWITRTNSFAIDDMSELK